VADPDHRFAAAAIDLTHREELFASWGVSTEVGSSE
jgi:hypothetical protein